MKKEAQPSISLSVIQTDMAVFYVLLTVHPGTTLGK